MATDQLGARALQLCSSIVDKDGNVNPQALQQAMNQIAYTINNINLGADPAFNAESSDTPVSRVGDTYIGNPTDSGLGNVLDDYDLVVDPEAKGVSVNSPTEGGGTTNVPVCSLVQCCKVANIIGAPFIECYLADPATGTAYGELILPIPYDIKPITPAVGDIVFVTTMRATSGGIVNLIIGGGAGLPVGGLQYQVLQRDGTGAAVWDYVRAA